MVSGHGVLLAVMNVTTKDNSSTINLYVVRRNMVRTTHGDTETNDLCVLISVLVHSRQSVGNVIISQHIMSGASCVDTRRPVRNDPSFQDL